MKIGNPILVGICALVAVGGIVRVGMVLAGDKPAASRQAPSADGAAPDLVKPVQRPVGTSGLLASLDRDPFGDFKPSSTTDGTLLPMQTDPNWGPGSGPVNSGMGGMSPSVPPLPPVRPTETGPAWEYTPAPGTSSLSGNLPSVYPNYSEPDSVDQNATDEAVKPMTLILRALITAEATIAYIEIDGKTAKPFKEGETVVKGVVVKDVSKRSIVLSQDNELNTLRVGQEFQPK